MFVRCRLNVLGSWSLLSAILLIASSCAPPSGEPTKSAAPQKETSAQPAATTPAAHDGLWLTDFEAAKKLAKDKNLLLLVDFTGSDWCGWCVKLKSEVFDKPEFKAEAPKNFVLVELDFPRQKELPENLKKQNEKLKNRYKIQGFPSILLLDAGGEMIAKTGYRDGGPTKYVEHLAEIVKIFKGMGALKAKLEGKSGIDRAKILDQLIESYDKLGQENKDVAVWSKEIVKLDADNGAGLKSKYEFRVLMDACVSQANEGNFKKARAKLKDVLKLADLTDQQKQTAYWVDFQLCQALKDLLGAENSLEKALEADPNSGLAKKIEGILKQIKPMAKLAKLKADAKKATGEEKAKLLDELVEAISEMGDSASAADQEQCVEWSREIVSLDPENKAGLKSKHEFRSLMADADKAFDQRKYSECRAAAEKAAAVSGITGEQTQKANLRLALCLREEKKFDKCLECLKKALDAAPQGDEADRINRLIKAVEKDIEKEKGGKS